MDNNLNNISQNDLKEYSITEIYFLLKKYFKLIFIIILFFTISTVYYTLLIKPTYKSTSVIMVSEIHKPMSMLELGLGRDRNYIENEIQILKSRTTSELVINRLLQSDYKNNLYLLNTRKYEPTFYRKYLTLGLLDRYQDIANLEDSLSSNIKEKFAKKLQSSISINNQRGTDAFEISVTSLDPNEASLLVNTVVDVYKERDLKWATGEMSHVKIFLQDQLKIKKEELNKTEILLKKFQEKERIFNVDGSHSIILENMMSVESEYNKILSSIEIYEQRINYLNSQLNDNEKNLSREISNTLNENLLTLQSDLTKTESQLISTIVEYGEGHNAVNIKREKLEKLKKEIDKETSKIISQGISVSNPILFRQDLMDSLINVRFTLANLEATSKAYKKLVLHYDSQLSLFPQKILEFTKLERERSIHAETYSFMSSKLEEARIGEASKLDKIRIIDRGITKPKPIKPNKKQNAILGFILGIGVSLFIVITFEYFDNTIKSIEQIERIKLPILSMIPSIDQTVDKKKRNKYSNKNINVANLQRRLITHEDPKSPISEAYRGLRTSLMYTKNSNKKTNFILISSVGPGEGKTTTIANLAITYANLGKKTLLIDSDLRKPVIHKVFKVDKTPGLTSYLSQLNKIDEIIKNTEIENLDIITSGVTPPNPSELLDSNNMNTFIDKLNKKEYDIILFDSPPLIAVTDAYVLLKHIQQFILVVRAGITEKGGLQRVLTAFEQTNFDITGVVMNAMKEEHSYGAGYYYNYYQYYYSDNEQEL